MEALTKHVGAKLSAGDRTARCLFDARTPDSRDAVLAPLLDHLIADAKLIGECFKGRILGDCYA